METTIETMEEQIKKLIKLANEYANFVGRKPIERHIKLQYGDDYYEKIELYFTPKKEYLIKFEKIEICEFCESITIPFDYTAKDLERVYNTAKNFFDNKKSEINKKILEDKEKEIEELKEKLKKLEKK